MVKCLLCYKSSGPPHHIFCGSGNRKISDKYGLVVPLCPKCHSRVHRHKTIGISEIFHKLCLKFTDVVRIMHKPEKLWTEEEKKYIISVGNMIKEFYNVT